MRALVCRHYGPPEDLEIAELPDPAPGPGEVLIQVRAATANFADALLIANAYQVSAQLPFVPGSELAGEVLAIGADVPGLVPDLKEGDRVFGTAFHGAFAERAVLPAGGVGLAAVDVVRELGARVPPPSRRCAPSAGAGRS